MKKFTLTVVSLFFLATSVSADGLIKNWDFSETGNGTGPAGWTPASVMGGKGKSRVHNLKSDQSSNDYVPVSLLNPENVSAFYFRYDYNAPEDKTYTYGAASGYELPLESETKYNLTFRYGKWMSDDNVANRSFKVVVKDAEGKDVFSKDVVVKNAGSVAISKSESDCYDFSGSFTTGSFTGTQNHTLNLVQGEGDVAFVITKINLTKEGATALEETKDDEQQNVYTIAGKLNVQAQAGVQVDVYSASGTLVVSYISGGNAEILDLSKGFYVVKAGETAVKAVVE